MKSKKGNYCFNEDLKDDFYLKMERSRNIKLWTYKIIWKTRLRHYTCEIEESKDGEGFAVYRTIIHADGVHSMIDDLDHKTVGAAKKYFRREFALPEDEIIWEKVN